MIFDNNQSSPQKKTLEILKLVDLPATQKDHIVRNARKLCEYLPNLVIYEPAIIIETEPLHLAVAVILEARRKCQLTPIWPEELDLIVFGPKVGSQNKVAVQEMILKVLERVQKSLYGGSMMSNEQKQRGDAQPSQSQASNEQASHPTSAPTKKT